MASIPAVVSLERRYEARGLRVIGLTTYRDDPDGSERKAIESIAQENGMNYSVYLDKSSTWAKTVGLNLRPSFLVLDAQGRIAFQYAGELVEGSMEYNTLANRIETLLASSP